MDLPEKRRQLRAAIAEQEKLDREDYLPAKQRLARLEAVRTMMLMHVQSLKNVIEAMENLQTEENDELPFDSLPKRNEANRDDLGNGASLLPITDAVVLALEKLGPSTSKGVWDELVSKGYRTKTRPAYLAAYYALRAQVEKGRVARLERGRYSIPT